MAKKLSAQTVTATAKTIKQAAQRLSADEENALRMRNGATVAQTEKLAQKTTDASVAAKLAQIELQAFKAMGAKVYGIGRAAPQTAATLGPRSAKDKIIKALKK